MADFDPYHKWLGIPKKDQPAHHYRLLGLDVFEDDPDVIDVAANRVMTFLQQCATGKHIALSQKLLNEVAQARVVLLNPAKKAKYDAKLQAQIEAQRQASETPAVEFAEAEPDPLSFLNQDSANIDLDAITNSPSRSSPMQMASAAGIPGWAVAFGLLVILGCCGIVGYRIFSDRTPPPITNDVASNDDSSDANSASTDDDSEESTRKRPGMKRRAGDGQDSKSTEGSMASASRPSTNNGTNKNESNPTKASTASTRVNPAGFKELTNRFGMTFVLLPKGDLSMGSPDDGSMNSDERPRHRVVLPRPFFMSKFEVTNANYDAVMGINRSNGISLPTQPVTDITWNDAMTFCRNLGQKENTHCRLPTEAEWEYACRAGTRTIWNFGDTESEVAEHAWIESNAERHLHPIGTRKPNAWGLYDMHGNAAEWCFDVYSTKYYEYSRLENPIGPEGQSTSTRVYRGGSWDSAASSTRSAYRAAQSPNATSPRIGFRVVMEADLLSDPLKNSEIAPFSLLLPQPVETNSSTSTSPLTTATTPVPNTTTETKPNKKTPPRPNYIPEEAIYWQTNWYWFPTDKVQFNQALATATARKGRLVAISSAAENDFVASNIHGPTLIGCAKIAGRWTNSVGQRQVYKNWAPGQPSGSAGETYAAIFRDGTWHDYLKDTLYFAVEWGDEN